VYVYERKQIVNKLSIYSIEKFILNENSKASVTGKIPSSYICKARNLVKTKITWFSFSKFYKQKISGQIWITRLK